MSLINAEVKVLAKVIALRLKRVLPRVISEEQNGFIKGRHLFFNILSLLNIIVIAMDAEKAFDRVEWRYPFAVLKKF